MKISVCKRVQPRPEMGGIPAIWDLDDIPSSRVYRFTQLRENF